jgi:hypothetical protein
VCVCAFHYPFIVDRLSTISTVVKSATINMDVSQVHCSTSHNSQVLEAAQMPHD